MIETYLRQLDAELHVPGRLRRRILDETRDHLLEAVEGGVGEEDAVRAFGPPDGVARAFHEQLAGSSAHRASTLTGVMLIALAAMSVAAPAYGAVTVFAGQVAVVAAVLSLVRSFRYRAEGAVPASALPDIYRANAVTLACVVAIVIDLAAHGASLVLAAGASALALAAAATIVHSLIRARPVESGEPESDAFDDLLALAPDNFASRAVAVYTDLRERRPSLAKWLDLRNHPWRFCALFAAACGLAVGIGHGLTDGGPPPLTAGHIARAIAAVLILAAIEGSAVVLAFLALGRVLGIRRA